MSERIMSAVLVALALLLPSCGGDVDSEDAEGAVDAGSGDGGGAGGSAQDAATPETGDEAAVGPYECLQNNVARRKSDGDTVGCGLLRCTVEDGCGNTALGCTGDEDCVSSTAEAGWEVDIPVHCTTGICADDPQ